jgi:hypothetical protein
MKSNVEKALGKVVTILDSEQEKLPTHDYVDFLKEVKQEIAGRLDDDDDDDPDDEPEDDDLDDDD